MNFITNKIESNPKITLQELVEVVENRFELRLSKQTISRHLDLLLYTLKDVRQEPEAANSSENKIKRQQFARSLLSYQSGSLPILFMDESNFNLHISRTEGRSRRGTRCTSIAAGSRGSNTHVIGCIGSLGLIHHEIRTGSFNKESAREWLRVCFRKANTVYGRNVVIVIDNAPCHSQIEVVLDEPEFLGNKILRLGPYSPMLNPIENIWSVIKAFVKRELAERIQEILNAERGEASIRASRQSLLESLIRQSLELITPSLCISCISGIQEKLGDAISLIDMIF